MAYTKPLFKTYNHVFATEQMVQKFRFYLIFVQYSVPVVVFICC